MDEYKGLIDQMDILKEKKTKLMAKKEILQKNTEELEAKLAALGVSADGDLAEMKQKLVDRCDTIKTGLDEIEATLEKMAE